MAKKGSAKLNGPFYTNDKGALGGTPVSGPTGGKSPADPLGFFPAAKK